MIPWMPLQVVLAAARPALPYLAAAVVLLGLLAWSYRSGGKRVELQVERAEQAREIETLKRERVGDADADAARRAGAAERLRDGSF